MNELFIENFFMNKDEIVSPNIKNFIESIRNIGYSFEVAVADLIDNSIAARASNIQIFTLGFRSFFRSI